MYMSALIINVYITQWIFTYKYTYVTTTQVKMYTIPPTAEGSFLSLPSKLFP